jgi:hypothetical protein
MPEEAEVPGAGESRRDRAGRLLRTHRGRVAAGAAVVLLAAGLAGGLGARAAEAGPFAPDRYCWDAWQEPGVLGDEGRRTGTDDAPTPRRPHGSCEVTLDDTRGPSGYRGTVRVAYGPAPKDPEERMAWLGGFLFPGSVPLPDELPGVVSGGGGLLVLPERCAAADGRPATVTLDADPQPGLGGVRETAVLLVAAANRGMELAGCAAGEPLRVTSPVFTLPEDPDDGPAEAGRDVCRVPGLDIEGTKEQLDDLQPRVGAVTGGLQTCSVSVPPWASGGEPHEEGKLSFGLAMIAEPRLASLVADVAGPEPPAEGWRGTGDFAADYLAARAECAGRPTVFVRVRGTAGGDGTEQFTAFTDAVTRRLGCAPLAPGRSGR